MDVQELIRRGYRALGLGAEDDVLALFDQLGGEPADWVVYEVGAFGRPRPTNDVMAMGPTAAHAHGGQERQRRAAGLRRAEPVAPAPPARF